MELHARVVRPRFGADQRRRIAGSSVGAATQQLFAPLASRGGAAVGARSRDADCDAAVAGEPADVPTRHADAGGRRPDRGRADVLRQRAIRCRTPAPASWQRLRERARARQRRRGRRAVFGRERQRATGPGREWHSERPRDDRVATGHDRRARVVRNGHAAPVRADDGGDRHRVVAESDVDDRQGDVWCRAAAELLPAAVNPGASRWRNRWRARVQRSRARPRGRRSRSAEHRDARPATHRHVLGRLVRGVQVAPGHV